MRESFESAGKLWPDDASDPVRTAGRPRGGGVVGALAKSSETVRISLTRATRDRSGAEAARRTWTPFESARQRRRARETADGASRPQVERCGESAVAPRARASSRRRRNRFRKRGERYLVRRRRSAPVPGAKPLGPSRRRWLLATVLNGINSFSESEEALDELGGGAGRRDRDHQRREVVSRGRAGHPPQTGGEMAGAGPSAGTCSRSLPTACETLPAEFARSTGKYAVVHPTSEIGLRHVLWKADGAPGSRTARRAASPGGSLPTLVRRRAAGGEFTAVEPGGSFPCPSGQPVVGTDDDDVQRLAIDNVQGDRLQAALRELLHAADGRLTGSFSTSSCWTFSSESRCASARRR